MKNLKLLGVAVFGVALMVGGRMAYGFAQRVDWVPGFERGLRKRERR
jgi:hypothetical protein